MKKLIYFLSLLGVLISFVPTVFAAKPVDVDQNGVEVAWAKSECTTIQDGVLTYSAGHYLAGEPLQVGFDDYGYNYQAHLFRGSYANAYLGRDGFPPYLGDDEAYLAENPSVENHWTWEYRDYQIQMKWNDAWLANTDCDTDGTLDRHLGLSSYIGSGAWEMYSEMENPHYMTKIVAAPADASLDLGVWYNADGSELGPVIWSEFAIVQEIIGAQGATYVSPSGAGLGGY